jgi:dynein heavy chain
VLAAWLQVAAATIELHQMVANTFLPTAVKFHYQFNLRDLSNVAQVRRLQSLP